MHDQEAQRRQDRKERFLREAQQPPPPLPVKRIAHPGGKIVTSDKDAALHKLIARKQAAGEALTDDQQRALAELTAKSTERLKELQQQARGWQPTAARRQSPPRRHA